jgi:hypothetical protein
LVLFRLYLTIDHNGRDTNGREKSKETKEVVEMLAEAYIPRLDCLVCCHTQSKGDTKNGRGCEGDTSGQARSNVDIFVAHIAGDAANWRR